MLLSTKPAARPATRSELYWRIQNNGIAFLYIAARDNAHRIRGWTKPDLCQDRFTIHQEIDHPFAIHEAHSTIRNEHHILHFIHYNVDCGSHTRFDMRICISEFHSNLEINHTLHRRTSLRHFHDLTVIILPKNGIKRKSSSLPHGHIIDIHFRNFHIYEQTG